MKLDYGTLLGTNPLILQNGLHIRSPLLKEISEITFPVYQSYLAALMLDKESYFYGIDHEQFHYFSNYSEKEKLAFRRMRTQYESFPEEEKDSLQLLDIIVFDPILVFSLQQALSFFSGCRLTYSLEKQGFIQEDKKSSICFITKAAYPEIADLILQRNGVSTKELETEKPVFKNELAKTLYYRTLEVQKNNISGNKTDKNMDLPNIISAVSARHPSLNIYNIWDITVYQLYDQFKRLQVNSFYDIQSMTVAAWGDEKKQFDASQWYKNLFKEN
ncbi:MAG: hypothetical protein E7247_12610 [Paenibacillaceae bacterium]|nr:hypothetical protein [Paenibacillaceae bacterium]